jgi:phosphohistidine phosphatase SixA
MKIFSVALLFIIASCQQTKYLYIVRHAEKLDNTPYSVLSPAGHQRAAILKDSLLNKKIDVIFVTPFQRTQETAKPLADAIHKPFAIYRNNAVDSIVTVLNGMKSKNILLVGHSGNLPAIIEGITGKKVNAIGENSYNDFYIIKTKKGERQLLQATYGPENNVAVQ